MVIFIFVIRLFDSFLVTRAEYMSGMCEVVQPTNERSLFTLSRIEPLVSTIIFPPIRIGAVDFISFPEIVGVRDAKVLFKKTTDDNKARRTRYDFFIMTSRSKKFKPDLKLTQFLSFIHKLLV